MLCAKCGYIGPADSRFCGLCGTPIAGATTNAGGASSSALPFVSLAVVSAAPGAQPIEENSEPSADTSVASSLPAREPDPPAVEESKAASSMLVTEPDHPAVEEASPELQPMEQHSPAAVSEPSAQPLVDELPEDEQLPQRRIVMPRSNIDPEETIRQLRDLRDRRETIRARKRIFLNAVAALFLVGLAWAALQAARNESVRAAVRKFISQAEHLEIRAEAILGIQAMPEQTLQDESEDGPQPVSSGAKDGKSSSGEAVMIKAADQHNSTLTSSKAKHAGADSSTPGGVAAGSNLAK